jgi:hypothetical protein
MRDRNYRMAFPKEDAKGYVLFSKYASGGDYRKVCKHIFQLQTLNPLIDDQLLDFETEARWFCLQNWVVHNPFGKGFPGHITSCIAFERQEDYAMFRMFGFGE